MLINSGVPGKPPEFPGPTIVYCPSRKDVEKVHAELQAHGVDSVMYHAGLSQAVLFIHPPLIILSTLLWVSSGIQKWEDFVRELLYRSRIETITYNLKSVYIIYLY